MATGTDRIQAIFQASRELQADALEMLAQGRIRNAAEKAWGAMKRGTGALVRPRNEPAPDCRGFLDRPEEGDLFP